MVCNDCNHCWSRVFRGGCAGEGQMAGSRLLQLQAGSSSEFACSGLLCWWRRCLWQLHAAADTQITHPPSQSPRSCAVRVGERACRKHPGGLAAAPCNTLSTSHKNHTAQFEWSADRHHARKAGRQAGKISCFQACVQSTAHVMGTLQYTAQHEMQGREIGGRAARAPQVCESATACKRPNAFQGRRRDSWHNSSQAREIATHMPTPQAHSIWASVRLLLLKQALHPRASFHAFERCCAQPYAPTTTTCATDPVPQCSLLQPTQTSLRSGSRRMNMHQRQQTRK